MESENTHRSVQPGHTCSIQNLIKIPAQPALGHGLETKFPIPMGMFSCGCFRLVSFFLRKYQTGFVFILIRKRNCFVPLAINSYLNLRET